MDEDKEKQIDLLEYWRIILRRRWIAIIFAGTILVLTMIFTFLAKPVYRSAVTLLIEEESSKILSIDEAFNSTPQIVRDLRGFNTQLMLLQSKSLAERVARKLNLLTRPELVSQGNSRTGLLSGIKYILTLKWIARKEQPAAAGPAAAFPPSNPYSGFAGYVLAGIEVNPVRDTKLVELSFSSPFPQLTTEIVNTLAEEFISFSVEKRYSSTQQASDFLTESIANLRDDLYAKERELQRYGQEKDILFLSETESTAVNMFTDLSEAYNQAMLERINADAEYRELKDLEGDSIPQFISDPSIQQLKTEYTRLRTDYQEKSRQLKPDHPEMVRITARLDGLKEEINKAADAAEGRLRAARQKEASIKATLDRQRGDVAKMKNNAILYNSIKSEVESKRRLLNTLLERQSETQLSAQLRGLNASNISIIDRAEVPLRPVSPNKRNNLLLALFFGLVGGIGLCFLVDYLDDTVKEPEEVEKIIGLPALGVVPFLASKGTTKGTTYGSFIRDRYSSGKESPDRQHSIPEVKEIELVNHLHPDSSLSEEYRTVRTSVLLSHAEKPPKVIGFTSAIAQEGKTSTVVNMAISFAQLHERVLLVDADLRKPRLHRLFSLRNVSGLTAFLTGKAPLKDVIHKTHIENIWVVPSGPVPPNPAELLNSKMMKDLLEEASQIFDIVLLDSPPVLAVIDPVIISSIADSMVMVIRAGKTRRKPLLAAVEELKRARASIIGVVLNAANLSNGGYSYSRYYRYNQYGAYKREDQDHFPEIK